MWEECLWRVVVKSNDATNGATRQPTRGRQHGARHAFTAAFCLASPRYLHPSIHRISAVAAGGGWLDVPSAGDTLTDDHNSPSGPEMSRLSTWRPSSSGPSRQPRSWAEDASSFGPAALRVTLLFTTAEPPLTLSVPAPSTTTVAALRLLVRSQRPSLATRKLRLISSGKVLPDGSPLSQLAPPSSAPDPADVKGKQKAVDSGAPLIFLHCAVGLPLSAAELATESSPLADQPPIASYLAPTPSTLPAPQGFDRLLTQGFSEREVAALRSQFNRLNPDLSTEDIRLLEDRWIDESAGQGQETLGGSAAGAYEDMLVGTIIGFFWPASLWLAREEGVFSQRRQYAVFAGVCVNIFFGLVRIFG